MIVKDRYVRVGGVLRRVTRTVLFVPAAAAAYDVVLLVGQSNARGVATDYVAADQYPAGVFVYNWAGDAIQPAQEPLPSRDTAAGMGAANTFVKAYVQDRLPSSRRLLIVNAARGGTGFVTPSSNAQDANLTWDRTAADNASNLALTTRAQMLAIMASLPAGSRLVAIVANHGSTDGTQNTPKATYKARLEDWISWIRTELGVPAVPYLMMQMRPDLLANETRHRILDEAQTELAASLTAVVKGVSPAGAEFYASDSVHFIAEGMRRIGTDLWTRFAQRFPGTTPAAPAVTFVDNGDGTVTYNGDGVTTDPTAGTFTLTGSNVTDNGDGTFTVTT